jgi:hypothetical protein
VEPYVAGGVAAGVRVGDFDDVEGVADDVGGLGDFVGQTDDADLH